MSCPRIVNLETGAEIGLCEPPGQAAPAAPGALGLRELLNPGAAAQDVMRRHEQALAAAFGQPAA